METVETLEEITQESVARYRDIYDEDVPATRDDIQNIMENGETAELEDLHRFLNDQTDFYDELLDTDYGELTQDIQERIRYQPSRTQIARDTFNSMNGAFTLVSTPLTLATTIAAGPANLAIPLTACGTVISNYKVSELTNEGMYMPGKNLIGVSNDETSKPDAYKVLASELFHAYQYEEESETWHHPFLREGLERASSVKALEQQYPEQAEAFKTYMLLTGSFQANQITDTDITTQLDLQEEKRKQLEKHAEKNKHNEYNLPASIIYAAEQNKGEQIYGQLFNNDYNTMEEELDLLQGNETKSQEAKSLFWKTAEKIR